MLHNHRHLVFRPSFRPGIKSPLTVRSAGHYDLTKWRERREGKPFTQLIWVELGSVKYRRKRTDYTAGANETFYFEEGEPHHIDVSPPGGRYWWITCDGALVGEWLSKSDCGTAPRSPGPCPSSLFREIESHVGLPKLPAEKRCAELGMDLLIRFAGSPEPDTPTPGTLLARQLQREIETRFTDPEFGIEKAADHLRRHRSTLYRAYLEAFGLTPSSYLKRLRIQAGLKLLREGRFNVDEVARRCGFRDANYFSRIIREATGESPRSFRNALN